MAVSLATLKNRLEGAVPTRGEIPSSSQYEQAVRDAVADYSRHVPLQKLATLNIVSGTATYTLPADFLKVIRLESPTSPDGVIISPAGLIPVGDTFRERYYIVGNQITFDPTPQYTMARDLWYAAAYVLDDEEIYQDMTQAVAGVVMLKARSLAMGYQAQAASGEILSYQIGDEKVEKGKTVEALRKAAQDLNGEYLAAVKATIGVIGIRG